jgi:acyl carrier protein
MDQLKHLDETVESSRVIALAGTGRDRGPDRPAPCAKSRPAPADIDSARALAGKARHCGEGHRLWDRLPQLWPDAHARCSVGCRRKHETRQSRLLIVWHRSRCFASSMENPVAARKMGPTSADPAQWKEAVFELAEARLRQLVAERLGINATQVRTDAFLVDDLGADEVDLLEIAVALEEEFGLVVPDTVLRGVCTYGDFSAALPLLLENLADPDVAELLASGSVRVRVIRNAPDEAGAMLRAVRLTPRVIEGIVEEVLGTAGVTRLELTCSGDTTDSQLARIAQRLAWLRNRGFHVSVQRLGQDTSGGSGATCHAAGDTVSQASTRRASADAAAPSCAGGIGLAE